jgi:hypothetical protein
LRLHGIFGCPEEPFDPQMLLDLFEEQFALTGDDIKDDTRK